MKKRVVGLGEVLWDLLPGGPSLGGAPANFAYITTLMGDQGIVASRVGEDSRGIDALRRMEELGLNIDYVQIDRQHPTGVVNVKVDGDGVAQYQFAHAVAWDFLEWNPDWQQLALDADVVKLNDDELPKLMEVLNMSEKDDKASARRLIRDFGLKVVCITRGSHGSLLVAGEDVSEHPGFRVSVADTVGSGDAFTAGLVHEYLHGASLDLMNEVANLVGAWVASEVGAMPVPKRGALEHSLAEIR
jgi:fructokinase